MSADVSPTEQERQLADRAVRAILASPKYSDLYPGLVERVYLTQLRGLLPSFLGRKSRAFAGVGSDRIPPDAHSRAVESTRRKLHETVGAFAPTSVFASMVNAIREAKLTSTDETRGFALRLLAAHPSTHERIPSLDRLYDLIARCTGPLHSVLDLGCGFHPLESPWMTLSPGCRYVALDVSSRVIAVVNAWQSATGMEPDARTEDVVTGLPQERFDLAFAMKLLPTLEQQGAGLTARLLDAIDARWLVVSYPRVTLSGRGVGMDRTYSARFEALTAGRSWTVEDISTNQELVYIIEKGAD
jgi:16S rRNA (guanine(1405)-N(7))-methyltransferase